MDSSRNRGQLSRQDRNLGNMDAGDRSGQGAKVPDFGAQGGKETLAGDATDSVHLPPLASAVEEQALGLRVVVPERLQPAKIRRVEVRPVLDLDREETILAIDDQIDFVSTSGAPVGELVPPPAVGIPGSQMLCDQPLQSRTFYLFCPIERAAGPERTEDARDR